MQSSPSLQFQSEIPSNLHADVIILGGGLSGLEIARELWVRGAQVVVLEGGPTGALSHVNQRLAADQALKVWLDARSSDPMFRLAWHTQNPPHYDRYSGLRQVVGGRSLYWHGVVLPIESWALESEAWPEEIHRDLSTTWRGGAGLYDQVLAELHIWSGEQEVGAYNPLVELLKHLGYKNAITIPYAVRHFTKENRWAAYSPLDLLLTEAADGSLLSQRGPAPSIFTESFVTSFQFSGTSSHPQLVVDVKGTRMQLEAPVIVLAAGTIENTRLVANYLNSENKQNIMRHFNLFDHIVQGFVVRLPEKLFPIQKGTSQISFNALIPGDEINRSNLFITAELKNNAWFLDSWEMGEQLPGSTRVEVPPLSNKDHPIVQVALSSEDVKVIERQQDSLKQLWSALAKMVGIQESELVFDAYGREDNTYARLVQNGGLNVDVNDTRTYYCPLGTVDHEAGTLPYGLMLDNKAGLLGREQIRVVGPASFPRMGAANPSLTTISLARRTAALIK